MLQLQAIWFIIVINDVEKRAKMLDKVGDDGYKIYSINIIFLIYAYFNINHDFRLKER